MEVLALLILVVVFGIVPMFGMIGFLVWITHKQHPTFWPRFNRFIRFLLLPHLYLHQMYNYSAKVEQGYKTNVQYMINGIPYEGNGLNYYEAMWNAAERPTK